MKGVIDMGVDLEKISFSISGSVRSFYEISIPYFRRFLRFLALPYCLLKVNWVECTKGKYEVAKDFLYIFFKLKYYPDNYSACRLWEKSKSEWAYYYGSNYDPYQRRKLRKLVQPIDYEIIFKDKVVAEMMCSANNIPTPNIELMVKKGDPIAPVVRKLSSASGQCKLIFKPRAGKGGGGITYCESSDGEIVAIQQGVKVSPVNLFAHEELIVQYYISQHKHMSLMAESTNTIRVVTLLRKDGSVLIVGCYARFGVGGSKVDNLSQGGICVAVGQVDGRLQSIGYDRLSAKYHKHPTSGIIFQGYQIPMWSEVLSLAKKIQSSFFFYPLLGMDIAITETGPLVIEVNSSYDNVDLEQAQGPILKDVDVYRAFKDYELFINKYQVNLGQGFQCE